VQQVLAARIDRLPASVFLAALDVARRQQGKSSELQVEMLTPTPRP
jgi:hypothetical protein